MQSFCNFNIVMLYHVYVPLCNKENITKQIIHIYTYYTQMMKLKSSTKMITMTVMIRKAATVVTMMMMMCDDDDYNDSE